MGRLIRGLAAEGNLRVLAVETTDIAEEARERHQLSPTATAALGRAMSGVLLLTFLLSKTPKERLVEAELRHGAVGARLTGAGFGGSTVALVEASKYEDFKKGVLQDYPRARFF